MDDPRDLEALEVERDYQRRLANGEVDMLPPDHEEEPPAHQMSGSGLEQDSPYEATFAPPGSGWVFSDPLMCARCARRRHIRTCSGACERSVCLGCLRWSPNAERCLLDPRVCCIDCYNNGLDHRGPAPVHTQFMRTQARRALWAEDVAPPPVAAPPSPPAVPDEAVPAARWQFRSGQMDATPVAPTVPAVPAVPAAPTATEVPHPDEVPRTHLSETLFTSDFAPRGPDGRRRCDCLKCELERFTKCEPERFTC